MPMARPKEPPSSRRSSSARKLEVQHAFQSIRKARLHNSARRWLLLFQPILRQARWMIAQEAWTGWMRSQAARLKTQLKLKGILWRAWTMQSKELKEQVKIPPHRDYPPASERVRTHLRTCSHRDVYILYRARAPREGVRRACPRESELHMPRYGVGKTQLGQPQARQWRHVRRRRRRRREPRRKTSIDPEEP